MCIRDRFKDVIEKKLQKVSENIRHANIHQGWRIMKDIIIDTAVEVCGVTKRIIKENRRYGGPVSYTHLDVYKRQLLK